MNNSVRMLEKTQTLVHALQKPALYDHPISSVSIIETHISWIILTGLFAYKIKKPVDFGFLDFTSLAKRKLYCEEEVRLNRRYAPDIYLGKVSIRGSHEKPNLTAKGRIIEYAVKMKQFEQNCLLSSIAEQQHLTTDHIDSMVEVVAEFHAGATAAPAAGSLGSAASIGKWSAENFSHIENLLTETLRPDYYDAIKDWCLQQSIALTAVMQTRKRGGFVRECHGDLHLGNMAYLDNRCTPFDCIEFNDELRWIDIISEVAFVVMDLQARGYPAFAWRFINRYLQIIGDYSGMKMYRYYLAYRALVRAKVAALSANQNLQNNESQQPELDRCFHYLQIAQNAIESKQPAIILMNGLSGSGKSTQAEKIAETLGAIQLRSDIERKRLFDLDKMEASGSKVNQGIYTAEAAKRTYQHLAGITEKLLEDGFCVIVDAAFLKTWQRSIFQQLAQKTNVPYAIVSCQVAEPILRERISRRLKQHDDPSEANLEVLEHQIETQQLIDSEELDESRLMVCDHTPISDEQIVELRQMITNNASS